MRTPRFGSREAATHHVSSASDVKVGQSTVAFRLSSGLPCRRDPFVQLFSDETCPTGPLQALKHGVVACYRPRNELI